MVRSLKENHRVCDDISMMRTVDPQLTHCCKSGQVRSGQEHQSFESSVGIRTRVVEDSLNDCLCVALSNMISTCADRSQIHDARADQTKPRFSRESSQVKSSQVQPNPAKPWRF
jgi:hypothetical protein